MATQSIKREEPKKNGESTVSIPSQSNETTYGGNLSSISSQKTVNRVTVHTGNPAPEQHDNRKL